MSRQNKLKYISDKIKVIEDERTKLINNITIGEQYLDKNYKDQIENNLNKDTGKVIEYKNQISFIDKFLDKLIYRNNLNKRIKNLTSENNHELENKLLENNNIFINRKKEELKDFLDNVEGKCLDENQREIILKDEINNLVVAGAGSGKTTVIVGKVEYLIKHCGYDSKDILVLSFTNKSAKEMQERIVKSSNCQVDAMTFHKLGLKIIEEVDKKEPEITDKNINDSIEEIINELLKDNSYLSIFNKFFSEHMHEYKSKFDFENLNEYVNYLKSSNIKSIKGEKLKSLEEVYIANFFYMYNINYTYERQYPYVKTKYKPDFYLPDYNIYIEHFGIDKNGNVPDFFEGKDGKSAKEVYNEGIAWKRELHEEKHTKLIESYSYEQRDGVLLDNLKKKLRKEGVQFKPRGQKEIFEDLLKQNDNEIKSLIKLISGFVSYMRANNIEISTVRKKTKDERNKAKRDRKIAFVELIIPILERYENSLRENNKIDFSDMINLALKYVKQNKYTSVYKYIIVDEYQDISLNRLNLIKSLRDQNKAKLFCVGDDWQSIYKFTGSEVALFTNFKDYVGYTECSKIEKTYRYNQSIVDISSRFVEKNPEQIKKDIQGRGYKPNRSKTDIINGIKSSVFLKYGFDNKSLKAKLIDTLRSLPKDSSVLLIGRYNFDMRNFYDEVDIIQVGEKVIFRERRDLDIKFMTAHKSKGLESDNVIIINTRSGQLGFPSNIEDDYVYELLNDNKNEYDYAEERRLFYVALTRTKNNVYLLVNDFDKSDFIVELEKEYGYANEKRDVVCPKCSSKLKADKFNNKVVMRCSNVNCDFKDYSVNEYDVGINGKCERCGSDTVIRSGPYGIFYGCSSYPYCDCTKPIRD